MRTIDQMLATMDIPERRRDWQQPDNLLWLLRNLGINNRDNPELDAVMRRLTFVFRKGMV